MVKFEDLKVGMRVKLKPAEECKCQRGYFGPKRVERKARNCGKVVTITKFALLKDETFKIEEDDGNFYHVSWIESIVEPEKPKQVIRFEDLKVGMRVRLTHWEKMRETEHVCGVECGHKRAKFSEKIVEIQKLFKSSFAFESEGLAFSFQWIEEIVNPENIENSEQLQNPEPEKDSKMCEILKSEDSKYFVILQSGKSEQVLRFKNLEDANKKFLELSQNLKNLEEIVYISEVKDFAQLKVSQNSKIEKELTWEEVQEWLKSNKDKIPNFEIDEELKSEKVEKCGQVIKFEDLKVGMRVRLTHWEKMKETVGVAGVECHHNRRNFSEKIVTIKKLTPERLSFFPSEDVNSYAFQWIVEICEPTSNPEKDYKFEDFQIGEVVRVKSFEECMKFENVDGCNFEHNDYARKMYCERTLTIKGVAYSGESFDVEECGHTWHYKWLEKVE